MVVFENDGAGMGAGAPRKIDKYYLFVVGIDHYEKPIQVLKNPVRDASRVIKTLLENYKFPTPVAIGDLREKYPALYGDEQESIPIYDDVQITTLYDADATRKAVREKWDRTFEAIGENDALLVYFAGHGDTDKREYYLPLADSKPGHWEDYLNVTSLYRRFRRYIEDKKCRDYLLILDCCYGGQIALGDGRLTEHDCSRYVLTSCMPYQLADDGRPGRGSPFANAFIRYLKDYRWPYLTFNKDAWYRLSSYYVEIARKRSLQSQEILFERLPESDTGPTKFLFEKRKHTLDVTFLKDSIVKDLNFVLQKADLELMYSNLDAKLNFLYTQGESSQNHTILVKVIFAWLSESRYIDWEPSACNGVVRVTIDKYRNDDIWDVLTKQIRSQGEDLTREYVLDWCLDQLRSDEEAFDGKCHLILWLNFGAGSRKVVERIQTFAVEFSKVFFDRLSSEPGDSLRRMGKLFIVFSDESNAGPSKPSDFVVSSDQFNFIPTRPVTKVKFANLTPWMKTFDGDEFAERLSRLNEEDVLQNLVGNVREWTLSEFVGMVCTHCKLSQTEKDDLLAMLYASCDKSLIPNTIADET